jgi:hypothetical protein
MEIEVNVKTESASPTGAADDDRRVG